MWICAIIYWIAIINWVNEKASYLEEKISEVINSPTVQNCKFMAQSVGWGVLYEAVRLLSKTSADLADITIEFTSKIAGVKMRTNAENFSRTEADLLKTYDETAFYWGKALGSLLVTAIGTGTGIAAGAAAIGSAAGGAAAAPVTGGTTVALGSVVSVEAAGVSVLGWTVAAQAAAALGDNTVAAIQKSAQGGSSNENPNQDNASVGQLTGSLDGLTSDERKMVNDLLELGKDVEIIPRSSVHGVKTPDFLVDGVKTELKTLKGTSLNTPVKRITEGFEQGASTVIIDARGTELTMQDAQIIISRVKGKTGPKLPGTVEIWTKEGVFVR